MSLNKVEYVVDSRDEHGQPAIIGRCLSTLPSELKIKDDRKLPKKRRAERRTLNHKDQIRLHELFVLPIATAAAKIHREERENAIKVEKERLNGDEHGTTENPVPTSQPVEVPQNSVETASSTMTLDSRNGSNTMIWLYATLCAIFLAMAQFPDFRYWIINEVVVKTVIDGLSPPLLQIACTVGEQCMETLPLTSNIILSLYSVFGFWPLAAVFVWMIWKIWDAITFVEMSFRNLVLQGMKK